MLCTAFVRPCLSACAHCCSWQQRAYVLCTDFVWPCPGAWDCTGTASLLRMHVRTRTHTHTHTHTHTLSPFSPNAQIRTIDRVCEIPHEGPFCDLMWSDPEDIETWAISPRGAGWLFGSKVTSEFNQINGGWGLGCEVCVCVYVCVCRWGGEGSKVPSELNQISG